MSTPIAGVASRAGRPDLLSRVLGGYAEPLRASDLLSPDQPPKPYPPVRRWRYNAGVRFLLMVVATILATLLVGLVAAGVWVAARGVGTPFPAGAWWMNVLAIPGFVIAYLLVALWWERRVPPYELAPRRAGGLLPGLLWGTVLQIVCVGILAVLGAYRVQGFDPTHNPVPALLTAGLGAAVNEEIMFRGILYRLMEDTFGTWVAVGVSGLVFGLAHLTNPQATWQGALAIALEAGVLFAGLYALTRSLWWVMGFHFAWNVVQGPVLGIVVSGSSTQGSGYVRSTLTGPEWLSGGAFGMEASSVTVVVLTSIAVWLLVTLHRRGLVVAPFWARRRTLMARTAPPDPDAAAAAAAA